MKKESRTSLCSVCSVDLKNCPYFLYSSFDKPYFIPGQECDVFFASDGNRNYNLYVMKKCPLFVAEEKCGEEEALDEKQIKQQEKRRLLEERKKIREERRREKEEHKRKIVEEREWRRERNLQAYYLRLSGMGTKEIAKHLGISRSMVFVAISKAKEEKAKHDDGQERLCD